MNNQQLTCIFCLQKTAVLKFDKHSKPYVKCCMCFQRVFMQGAHSLRGYVALSELLGSLEKEQLREYYNKANIALGSLYEKNSEVKNYVDQDSSLAVLKEVQYA